MYVRDALAQGLAGPMSRPGRSALTSLGAIVGVGALVAVIGLVASTQASVKERFAELSPTEVDATPAPGASDALVSSGDVQRVRHLDGVVGAGLVRLQIAPEPSIVAAGRSESAAETSPPLMAASVEGLSTAGVEMSAGRAFDAREEVQSAHVAILGPTAAVALDIRHVPAVIMIDGTRFLAIGIVRHVQREPSVLLDVVIPDRTEQSLLGTGVSAPSVLVVVTRRGYAEAVQGVLARVLAPANPSALSVTSPPSPASLAATISGDLTSLLAVLSVLSLMIGTVGIANVTLVSVLERVPEIGLRRAIGARRTQVAAQFVLESVSLGYLGGLIGTALGIVSTASIAVAEHWVPAMPVWVFLAAPQVGGGVGLLAGAYPAWRAASIAPMEALAR
jgi:putative ABC transport system permease protein